MSIQQPGRAPNHAHIELAEMADSGQADVILSQGKITTLHAQTDKPGAEFDVSLQNKAGHELARYHFSGEANRYGETVNLPLSDNYYIIKVENVKGAKSVDVFLE